jgi:hypothetical protein
MPGIGVVAGRLGLESIRLQQRRFLSDTPDHDFQRVFLVDPTRQRGVWGQKPSAAAGPGISGSNLPGCPVNVLFGFLARPSDGFGKHQIRETF